MLISMKYLTAESYLLNRGSYPSNKGIYLLNTCSYLSNKGSYLLNTENYHQIMTKASEKHLLFRIEGAPNVYINFSSNRIAR